MAKNSNKKHIRTFQICLLSMLCVVAPSWAAELPRGGKVTYGNTKIIPLNPGHLQIQQASQKTIIHWDSFSIHRDGWVEFLQPNNSSAALNRVTGNLTSDIAGRLTANGQVLLINPNGIIFTETAQIDAGSFMASTLDLGDQDFLAGNYKFNAVDGKPAAGIENYGVINAHDGGLVALLGANVVNRGIVTARYGQIAFGAGKALKLDFYGDKLLSVAVPYELAEQLTDINGQPLSALIDNTGTLQADGGVIYLAANTGAMAFRSAINNSGLVRAQTIAQHQGKIILGGGETGETIVAGKLDVTGLDTNEHGGTIEVTGDKVGIFAGATIDASGMTGGGTIHIGGDYQGQGDTQTATVTFIDQHSFINANATGSGNGGEIIIWADHTAQIHGEISAHGGSISGDGGFVETSGKESLEITSTPDVTASTGKGGEWLIDPNNITIVAGGATCTNMSPLGCGSSPFSTLDNGASIGVDFITAALGGGATVSLTTGTGGTSTDDGDINLTTALDYNGTGNGTLIMSAHNNININNPISDSILGGDSLNIRFQADSDDSGVGNVNVNALIETNGGSVDITGEDYSINAAIDAGTGNISFTETNTPIYEFGGAGAEFLQAEIDLLSTTGIVNFGAALDASGTLRTISTINVNDNMDFTGIGASEVVFTTVSGTGTGIQNFNFGVTATGTNFTLVTDGTVSQAGTADIFTDTLTLAGRSGGTFTLTNNTNDADMFSARGSATIDYHDANDITLTGTVNATNLALTAATTLSDDGTVDSTVTGTADFTATDITLNDTYDFNTLNAVASAGDVSINESNGLTLNNIATTGTGNDVMVVSGGSIAVDNGGVGNAITTTAGGTVTLVANGVSSDIVVNDGIQTVNGDIDLTAGNELIISGQGDINSTSGNFTFNTNSIDIDPAAIIASSGQLTFAPLSAATSIGLGDGTAGTLNFLNNELGTFQDGFSVITFGRPDGGGAVEISNASFTDNVLIHGGDTSLTGTLSSSAPDDAVIIDLNGQGRSGNFFNTGGDIQTPNGRWLIYAFDPSVSVEGSLSGFEHEFNKTFNSAPSFSNSGFVYATAIPVVPDLPDAPSVCPECVLPPPPPPPNPISCEVTGSCVPVQPPDPPTVEPPVELPEEPTVEIPEEPSAEPPVETVVETPVEPPVETTVDTPVESPVETTVDSSVESNSSQSTASSNPVGMTASMQSCIDDDSCDAAFEDLDHEVVFFNNPIDLSDTITAVPIVANAAFKEAMSTINNQLRDSMQLKKEIRQVITYALTGTTLMISLGFIGWTFKTSVLFASLLSAMPMWSHFDPLPVVSLSRNQREKIKRSIKQAKKDETDQHKEMSKLMDNVLTSKDDEEIT